jgi:hypothetical protein
MKSLLVPANSLRIAAVCLSLVFAFIACTGDSGTVYFTHPTNGWKLKEAINSAKGTIAQPSMDWYAEYERFPTPMRSELVVLSGHDASALRSELQPFALRPTRIRGSSGQAGVGPDKNKKPAVAYFEPASGFAVMALSYDIDVTALLKWMRDLRESTEKQWLDAGGRIVE